MTLEHDSSVVCAVVDMACLSRFVSAPRWTIHSSAGMKKLKIRRPSRRLPYVMMSSCYPNFLRRLMSCIILFVSSISPIVSITGCVTGPSSLIYVSVPGSYLRGGITSNYLQFPRHVAQVNTSKLRLVGGVRRVLLLCVPTPPFFADYSLYIISHSLGQNVV